MNVEERTRCKDCGDRGWIVVELGDSTAARRCECMKGPPRDLPAVMARAGLLDRDIQSALEDWDCSAQREPRALWEWAEQVARGALRQRLTAEEYVRRAKARTLLPSGWLLIGRPGRGKSKAAAMAAAAYLRACGRRLLWVSCREAAERVMDERAREFVSAFREQIFAAELLILDDLGTQRPEHSGEVEYWVYQRHAERAATIATLNDTRPEGTDGGADPLTVLDDRLVSRFADWELCEFVGPDYRQEAR